MALDTESVFFSHDQFLISNYCDKDLYDQLSSQLLEQAHEDTDKPSIFMYSGVFDHHDNNIVINSSSAVDDQNVNEWECCPDNNNNNSSLDQISAGDDQIRRPRLADVVTTTSSTSNGRRKRRRRVTKNKEEAENQRMTHIAVERNRRKQMNEYLAIIRSLMPASYVQRGDQASIVGGAINYVKELEQLLQSLEARKRIINDDQRKDIHDLQDPQADNENFQELSSTLFSEFFTFPQYNSTGSQLGPAANGDNKLSNLQVMISNVEVDSADHQQPAAAGGAATAKIEVTMVDRHANVKILAKKQPKQLLKLVDGFQRMRLSVLHLNVTTVDEDQLVLHSFSLKVEEGSELSSTDEIAAAANHILHVIQDEGRQFSSRSCSNAS
ncbi:hypothetical protein Dimus_006184 [Dionaea muscipula]